MGKRQKRENVFLDTFDWNQYFGKEVTLVCSNGAVYRVVLQKRVVSDLLVTDMMNHSITIAIKDLKEIIVDFVSQE